MTMASSLPVFDSFDIHCDGNTAIRWRKWISRLENLFVAMDIGDVKRKRALLLHYGGEDLYEIFETLPDTGEDFETLKEKLNRYFEPKKNKEYEIYRFRQARQNDDESIDEYHTRLRQLSRNCNFYDVDGEIKSQLIQCCVSSRLRRKGLKTPDVSLEQLLDDARALEISEKQASGIEVNAVNSVAPHKQSNNWRKPTNSKARSSQGSQKVCYNCGGRWPHDRVCPAQGKCCHNCGKMGHFSKCCKSQRSKPQRVLQINDNSSYRGDNRIQESDSSSEEYCQTTQLSTADLKFLPRSTERFLSFWWTLGPP